MNKLNDKLLVAANISVVVGIIFLVVEVAQNTRAIESQTRDSITEKQMEYYGWLANNRELAAVAVAATTQGTADFDPVELRMWMGFANATLREWENSHYQYEHGLFNLEEFEGRLENMRRMINTPGFRSAWDMERGKFAAAFRDLIDGLIAPGDVE